jgi:hypothetical protein
MTGEILGGGRRRKRREQPRTVVFHWERRSLFPSWAHPRHARTLVVAAIAVGALWVVASAADRRRRIEATRAAIASVVRAAETFRADHGRCPSSVAELARPPQGADGAGRYLSEARADGWGNALAMTCPGHRNPGAADVRSEGVTEGLFATGPIE